jgi:transcriptional activator of comK gene
MTSCDNKPDKGNLKSVGLLVPETIKDQVWGTKGYKGLLNIQENYNVDVYYKEGIETETAINGAVKDLADKGVNLIFGHGEVYAKVFNKLAIKYPSIHFVSFNGDANKKNTTSLSFDGHAMGFFGGMVAAHMSSTKTIGVIAAIKSQPEVKGFIEGAKYENAHVHVLLGYTYNWDDEKPAIRQLNKLIANHADVIYPAGDGFNVPVIEKVREKNLYAIGYVSDQSDLGRDTVLTSTVQHVSRLYSLVAEEYVENKLKSGNLTFDFKDGIITMGKFSPLIDQKYLQKLNRDIDNYKLTGKLPKDTVGG